MRTFIITGGTSGIGKGLAMHYLNNGDRVIAIGSSVVKGELFYEEAKKAGAQDRAIYIQADLSLVKENYRVIEEIKSRFTSIDALVLCAQYQKNTKLIIKTNENFVFSFGLYYLSRYILSYGLKVCLENATKPVILNVCAPGMKGTVNWEDLQSEKNYSNIKSIMHGSRLNDLLGVSFATNNKETKIRYILFNPGAVQTNGTMEAFEQPIMRALTKLLYKLIGSSVEKAIQPIIRLLESPPAAALSAYMKNQEVSLTMETFNNNNAQNLNKITEEYVKQI